MGFLADALAAHPGAAVSPAVLAATLGAACAHAAWNSIAHAIPDKVAAFTLVSLGSLLCSVPLVILAAPPGTRCWGYLAASATIHVVYSGLLPGNRRPLPRLTTHRVRTRERQAWSTGPIPAPSGNPARIAPVTYSRACATASGTSAPSAR